MPVDTDKVLDAANASIVKFWPVNRTISWIMTGKMLRSQGATQGAGFSVPSDTVTSGVTGT